MKTFYTFLILACIFSVNAVAQGNSKMEEIVVKTAVFCDHCNYCDSCKPRIETALFAVAGVKQAKLHIESQTIKIVYNTKKTSKAEILNAILSSGYAADGLQPKATDYARLEGCCKRK